MITKHQLTAIVYTYFFCLHEQTPLLFLGHTDEFDPGCTWPPLHLGHRQTCPAVKDVRIKLA